MPKSNSATESNGRGGSSSRGRGGYRNNFGRGGRNFYAQSAAQRSKQNAPSAGGGQSGPANMRALNVLNQYYSDKFQKLKRDADMRGMKN